VTGIPAALALTFVLRYGVNVPVWDEWLLAPVFADAFSGRLHLADLVAQHNEHRPFFPRILFITITALGGWNTRVDMVATLTLMLAVAIACAYLARQTLGDDARKYALPLLIANLIFLSPAQWETLLWGFVINFVMPAAGLVSAMLAARLTRSSRALVGVAASCTVATFSAAHGLVLWPIATAVALWFHRLTVRKDLATWIAYAAWFTAVLWLYFRDYVRPSWHPPLQVALHDPIDALAGFCAFLGGSLTFPMARWGTAVFVGAALAVILTMQVWWLLRQSNTELIDRGVVWIAMAAYAVISGALVTVGRLGFGREAFAWSRYITISSWAVIAAIMLGALLASAHTAEDHAGGETRNGPKWMLYGAILTLYLITLQPAFEAGRHSYRERLQLRSVFLFADVAGDEDMKKLFIDDKLVRHGITELRRAGIVEKQPQSLDWDRSSGRRCDRGFIDTFELTDRAQGKVSGWSFLPGVERPADAVLLTVERQEGPAGFGVVLTGEARDDVKRFLGTDDALRTGWTGRFALPVDRTRLGFWAFDAESRSAYPLCVGQGASNLVTASRGVAGDKGS